MADESNVEQVKFPPPLELDCNHELSIDKIASKLLKDSYFLTALELHAELLEGGKELPRLRDYFSNPGNFEKREHTSMDVPPVLPRTSSVQTLDSLDLAKYSDDGGKQLDEKVAVLEFELRKARETIKNLRANLTIVTESELNTPDDGSENAAIAKDPVRPHERRAVNFLVNEYLLKHNYKLTSITFSDENEDQDFEDWDDVGLNISKPPDLLHLYRSYSKHSRFRSDATDAEMQTDTSQKWESEEGRTSLEARNAELQSRVLELQGHLQRLSQENRVLTEELGKAISSAAASKEEAPLEMAIESPVESTQVDAENLTLPAAKSPMRKGPEGQGDSNEDDMALQEGDFSDSELSNTMEVTVVAANVTKPQVGSNRRRHMSSSFLNVLTSVGLPHWPIYNKRLAADVTRMAQNGDDVILLLARCLPHIIPNVILTKREELVPLLVAAVALHPEAKVRDALLRMLFNLIRRPDEDQRRVILTALLTIARCLGHARVEAELLPQCWEQIGHKYIERRLLVAESCGHLASYVAAEMCSSLLLSMLQQMLREDQYEMVRETAARSLAVLLTYVEDQDKFSQAVELTLMAIRDEADCVSKVGRSVLLPSVASWAIELGRLETELLPAVMRHIEENFVYVFQTHTKRQADGPFSSISTDYLSVKLIKALESAIPCLLTHVLQSGPLCIVSKKSTGHPKVAWSFAPKHELLDPVVIIGDGEKLAQLVQAFDEHIGKEWYRTWHAFDWVVTEFLPFLTRVATQLEIQSTSAVRALSQLLSSFCYLFGRRFNNTKVKPAFVALIPVCREEPDGAVATNVQGVLAKAAAPVYICGVLTAFCYEEDEKRELATALQDLLRTTSFCRATLAGIQYIVSELCSNTSHHRVLLSVLLAGVVHSSAAVRANTARLLEPLVGAIGEALLENRVFPAVMTLASDPELSVRAGTVRSLGAILVVISKEELSDKAYMQLQTFLADAMDQTDFSVLTEMIHVFATYGPCASARVNDEFIIPRLADITALNSQNPCEANRAEVVTLLVKAYTALALMYISEQLISEAFLPGLRSLYEDVRHLCPNHDAAVASMIQDCESRLDFSRERIPLLTAPLTSMVEIRRKMSNLFGTPPANARANLPSIFHLRKK